MKNIYFVSRRIALCGASVVLAAVSGAVHASPLTLSNGSGASSIVLGYDNAAAGVNASSFGILNSAAGTASIAAGYDNDALGVNSTALGLVNAALGRQSTALGFINSAEGAFSIALGFRNMASGIGSAAVGAWNEATQYGSSALGYRSRALGKHSSAFGFNASTTQDNEMVFGTAAGSYAYYNSDGTRATEQTAYGATTYRFAGFYISDSALPLTSPEFFTAFVDADNPTEPELMQRAREIADYRNRSRKLVVDGHGKVTAVDDISGSNADRIATAETSIGDHGTRITTVESDLLAANIGDSSIAAGSGVERGTVYERIQHNADTLGFQDSRIATAETNIGEHGTRITTVESDLLSANIGDSSIAAGSGVERGTVYERIQHNADTLGSQDSRITTVETDLVSANIGNSNVNLNEGSENGTVYQRIRHNFDSLATLQNTHIGTPTNSSGGTLYQRTERNTDALFDLVSRGLFHGFALGESSIAIRGVVHENSPLGIALGASALVGTGGAHYESVALGPRSKTTKPNQIVFGQSTSISADFDHDNDDETPNQIYQRAPTSYRFPGLGCTQADATGCRARNKGIVLVGSYGDLSVAPILRTYAPESRLAFGFGAAMAQKPHQISFGGRNMDGNNTHTTYRFAGLGCDAGSVCQNSVDGAVWVNANGELYVKKTDGTEVGNPSPAGGQGTGSSVANNGNTGNPNPPVTPPANEGGGTGGNSGGTVANTLGSASFGAGAAGLSSASGDADSTLTVSGLSTRVETEVASLTERLDTLERYGAEMAQNATNMATDNARTLRIHAQGIAAGAALSAVSTTVPNGDSKALSLGLGSFEGENAIAIGFSGRFGRSIHVNFAGSRTTDQTTTRAGITWSW